MVRSPASLDQIVARSRWTHEDARVVLAALAGSGLSVGAFAARYRVQAQRLAAWRRKLAAPPARTAPATPLAFVEVAPRTSAPPASRYEVVLAAGDVLRIEGAIDAAAVRTLLALLRAGPAC